MDITFSERNILFFHKQVIRRDALLEIVSSYLRRSSIPITPMDLSKSIAYRFIMNLHHNYLNHRDVQFYAAYVLISPSHFRSIVKKTTNISPSEWITNITISYAKYLLERTELSIKEVAQKMNFPEQFTFRKYFKQHSGMSPTEYKNR